MKTSTLLCTIACLSLGSVSLAPTCIAQTAKNSNVSPVLSAAKAELDRDFAELKKQPIAPYYLSYEIIDSNTVAVSSTFGALVRSNSGHRRVAHIDVRVGDYALDNTRQVRGKGSSPGSGVSIVAVPIEDDPLPIRSALWLETDKRYKRALTQLAAVQTNNQVKIEQEDKSADFSHEKPEQAIEPTPELHIDRKLWEEKTRKYTAPFHRYGDLFNSTAVLVADQEARWFVSSDGSMIQTSTTYYRLFIEATSKASDGMELPRYESFAALTPQGLPDDSAVLKAVDKMIADLKALRAAPVVDPYTGPAILSGRASAVFFTKSSAIVSRAIVRRANPKARPSRRWWASPFCPPFSPSTSTPRSSVMVV